MWRNHTSAEDVINIEPHEHHSLGGQRIESNSTFPRHLKKSALHHTRLIMMKKACSVVLLLIAVRASAFTLPSSQPRDRMSHLAGYRQNYLFNLEEMNRSGNVMVNGQHVRATQAVELVEQEIQAVEQDSNDAQNRMTSLEQQIKMTEQEQLNTLALLQASLDRQMREREQEQMKKDMTKIETPSSNAQVEKEKAEQRKAEEDRAVIIQRYQAREQQLRKEMAVLTASLEQEKEHIRVNQDMTNKLLETRVELDQELGDLKRKYAMDAKEWEIRLQQERKFHESDIQAANDEIMRLKKEVEAMSHKQGKVDSFVRRPVSFIKNTTSSLMSPKRGKLRFMFRQSVSAVKSAAKSFIKFFQD